jgi:hypothetical protein
MLLLFSGMICRGRRGRIGSIVWRGRRAGGLCVIGDVREMEEKD